MRLTSEQKGLAVLDALMDVHEENMKGLMRRTDMPHRKVRDGINWIRDYAPNALIVKRRKGVYLYKIAEDEIEVGEHVSLRTKSLYRQALRLERMTAVSLDNWPNAPLLKILHRHLVRVREDAEAIV